MVRAKSAATTALVVLVVGLLISACGSSQHRGASVSEVSGSHLIPAGTTAEARLNTAVGTSESSPGQYITATLATPMTNASGKTVIAPGALLTGRVVAVERGSSAAIRLLWTSIDAGAGPASFSATVRQPRQDSGAPFLSSRFSSREILGQGLPYNAVLLPPTPTGPSVGGGPARIDLPAGTAVVILLTRPLEYPLPAELRPEKTP